MLTCDFRGNIEFQAFVLLTNFRRKRNASAILNYWKCDILGEFIPSWLLHWLLNYYVFSLPVWIRFVANAKLWTKKRQERFLRLLCVTDLDVCSFREHAPTQGPFLIHLFLSSWENRIYESTCSTKQKTNANRGRPWCGTKCTCGSTANPCRNKERFLIYALWCNIVCKY